MKAWLNTLEVRVRAVIEESDGNRWTHLRHVLTRFSSIYGAAVTARSRAYADGILHTHTLPCRVISVGNLAVGGTGKTPMTIYLARLLRRIGSRVAILSRGYGGAAEKKGGVVSDGRRILMSPLEAGDEPYLMARLLNGVPVLVGGDRYCTGLTAVERFGVGIVILDDGFQHLRLARDLDLVLLDAVRPLGNGFLLPRGILREPVQALERADLVVMTRAGRAVPDQPPPLVDLLKGRPLFYAWHRPVIRGIVAAGTPCGSVTSLHGQENLNGRLAGKKVAAFAGLANPESFWDSIRMLEGEPVCTRAFDDHYCYRTAEMQTLAAAAVARSLDCLATSAKDFMRLPPQLVLPLDLVVVDVDIDLGNHSAGFDRHIRQIVGGDMSPRALAQSRFMQD